MYFGNLEHENKTINAAHGYSLENRLLSMLRIKSVIGFTFFFKNTH